MKAGHFIIIGLVIWILFSSSDSIWIYKSNGHIIAASLVGLSSIIWLSDKNNRVRLRMAFASRNSMIDQNTRDKLLSSIQIGLITIFSFTVIASEISKFLVRQSEGYKYITSEVTNSKPVRDQIGEIKYIAIGNSLSAGLSFKDSEKRLKTSLKVFGASGQINVDIEATKTDDWKIEDMQINE